MIKIKRIGNHTLPLPSQANPGDAGYDLAAAHEAVMLCPGGFALIATGFAVAIPFGWVGMIRDRSGIASKRRLTTRAGVIDSGYRGEIKVLLRNESEETQYIWKGDRIAQIVIVPYYAAEMEEVDILEDTGRGENGFGSTDTVRVSGVPYRVKL